MSKIGLFNKKTNEFDTVVDNRDDLWLYIKPDHDVMNLSEKQANGIAQVCGLNKPKSPKIISAKLVAGKIFTGTRAFETPVNIKITQHNYDYFVEFDKKVPREYYKINTRDVEKPTKLNLDRNLIVLALNNSTNIDCSDLEDEETVKFICENITNIKSHDIKNFCYNFGPEKIISWLRNNEDFHPEYLDGILDYSISNNDVELFKYLVRQYEEGYLSYDTPRLPFHTDIDPATLITGLFAVFDTNDIISSIIKCGNCKLLKYIIDNCEEHVEFNHLIDMIYRDYYAIGKKKLLLKKFYVIVESRGKMEIHKLMDIALESGNPVLAEFLHDRKYVYNIPKIVKKYLDIEIATLQQHEVFEIIVRKWSVKDAFDKAQPLVHRGLRHAVPYRPGKLPNDYNTMYISNGLPTNQYPPGCRSHNYNNVFRELTNGILSNKPEWWKTPSTMKYYSNEELKDMVENTKSNYSEAQEILASRGYYDYKLPDGLHSSLSIEDKWEYLLHNNIFNPYED